MRTGGSPILGNLYIDVGSIKSDKHGHYFSSIDDVPLDLGVSENSVPLNPMVNDHSLLNGYNWDKPIFFLEVPHLCELVRGNPSGMIPRDPPVLVDFQDTIGIVEIRLLWIVDN